MTIPCVIFDIDGTLSDNEHRQHHLDKRPKDWKAFFDACGDDPCHDYVLTLNHIIAVAFETPIYRNHELFVFTGRPNNYRRQTVKWLNHNKVRYDHLSMRDEGDGRPDHVVKLEMLEQCRLTGYRPLFAVDDRPEVVEMWRANGVPCFVVDDSPWRKRAAQASST